MALNVKKNAWLLEGRIQDDVKRSLRHINARLERVHQDDVRQKKPLEEARDLLRDSRTLLAAFDWCRMYPDDPRCIPAPAALAARATFENKVNKTLAGLQSDIATISQRVDSTICADCSPSEARKAAKQIANVSEKVAKLRVKIA